MPDYINHVSEELIRSVRLALDPNISNWVLFSNGTIITFDSAVDDVDLEQSAIRELREYGPVHAGSEAGDFNVLKLDHTKGWLVTSYRPNMFTFVHPEELNSNTSTNIAVGIYGRSKRDKDSKELVVVHIHRAGK